jgi:hypothetical protein
MKTKKFITIFSLAVILIGVTTGFSTKDPTGGFSVLPARGISYQVIIHQTFSIRPCNTYLVQVADGNGHLVAPAQVYVPGTYKYSFKELFSNNESNPRRVAMLIKADAGNLACSFGLFTLPDVKRGPFLQGVTYIFNLYPQTQSISVE